MTPEQAAAVAKIREALPRVGESESVHVCVVGSDLRAILAALDAAQAEAQAPREVPRLTPEDIMTCFYISDGEVDAFGRAVESRVREMCGVSP